MKKFKIPIFTNEYSVIVYIGKRIDLVREGAKFTTYSPKTIERDFINRRGVTYDLFANQNHPLILIDGDMSAYDALATLAHEAVHAVRFIENYLGIKDSSDEFTGHGVGIIMRTVGKIILNNLPKE
jgi:Zn-dependent peptidase ImmA (M78 family)